MNIKSPGDQPDELLELENYINDIWHFLPIPVAYINPMGIILDAGDSFINLLGQAKEDIVGTSLEDFFTKKEEYAKLHNRTINEGSVRNFEAAINIANNWTLQMEIATAVRKSTEEMLIGYFIAFFDLTEINKIQNELKDKIEELELVNSAAVGRELKMIELEKKLENQS